MAGASDSRPKLPRLGALEVFEAAGRLGSFDAAAGALHVTPGMARSISTVTVARSRRAVRNAA